ncbi:hypothetical protein CPB84DRAFT_700492 [Gymnopilus junonius]|uniref:Uncharacterized protein n=1 Tax=Gymnopilus junonius TaxID=109634 RepID=A0A9P5TP69_GYMJU|nr:hypothetical protein CPB84DRAFT_700492 [Gymnopilus junonius]
MSALTAASGPKASKNPFRSNRPLQIPQALPPLVPALAIQHQHLHRPHLHSLLLRLCIPPSTNAAAPSSTPIPPERDFPDISHIALFIAQRRPPAVHTPPSAFSGETTVEQGPSRPFQPAPPRPGSTNHNHNHGPGHGPIPGSFPMPVPDQRPRPRLVEEVAGYYTSLRVR